MAKTKPVNFWSVELRTLCIQLLFLAFTLYILYVVVNYVIRIMAKGCTTRCHFIVQEGFATNFDDSKAYFNSLTKKCNVLSENITTMSANIDDLEIKFGGLKKDICYVTKQVDEGLQGNYASNVPDEEQTYPPEEQKKRADERKTGAAK